MAIKRRDQQLTPKETIEKAQHQLAPFWVGMAPMIAASRSGTTVKAYPLDPLINERHRGFFFMIPVLIRRWMRSCGCVNGARDMSSKNSRRFSWRATTILLVIGFGWKVG